MFARRSASACRPIVSPTGPTSGVRSGMCKRFPVGANLFAKRSSSACRPTVSPTSWLLQVPRRVCSGICERSPVGANLFARRSGSACRPIVSPTGPTSGVCSGMCKRSLVGANLFAKRSGRACRPIVSPTSWLLQVPRRVTLGNVQAIPCRSELVREAVFQWMQAHRLANELAPTGSASGDARECASDSL